MLNDNFEKVIDPRLKNIPIEMCFIGCLFKDPQSYVFYNDTLSIDYDFTDEVTKFLFRSFVEIFSTSDNMRIDETKVNLYMSQDSDRLRLYKAYGGFKTIQECIGVADVGEIERYHNILKKYSLLREYSNKGIDVIPFIESKEFNNLNADDVYKIMTDMVSKVYTKITKGNKNDDLAEGMTKMVNSYLTKPQIGKSMPWPILSNLFRGMLPQRVFCLGLLSNKGKTRWLISLVAWLAIEHREKCLLLLNEMTIDRVRSCLLTTIINDAHYKELVLNRIFKDKKYLEKKPEKEIVSGLFKNKNGEFIYRQYNEDWDEEETDDQYLQRVAKDSPEYNDVVRISSWIEQNVMDKIYVKDMCGDFSDTALIREIKTAYITKKIKYFFYDTMKDYDERMGEWTGLKKTTTELSTLANQLNVFIGCTIQLTDDSEFIEPSELTSNNIANCKQLKHIVDGLVLGQEIYDDRISSYYYRPTFKENGELNDIDNLSGDADWGSGLVDIHKKPGKRYYVFNVDKNRDGEKRRVLLEIDLNLNTWVELGEVFRKNKAQVKEFKRTNNK